MDIISKHEWEYIKQQHPIWNKYTHSIPVDDRDLAILDLGDVVVLPKFFIQNNYEELYIHQIGHDIINRHNERLKNIKPSGTPLQLMKTSIEPRKEQIPIFEAIRNKKESNEPINGLVIAQPGFGKMQCYSEPILTPDGWTTMGELKVGSHIIGKNGKPIKVTHLHEHGEQDVYKVSFQDGTHTLCGLDHLWTVKNRHKITNKNKGWETINTSEILKKFKSGNYKTKYNTYQQEYKYKISLCDEILFDKKDLQISAFAMGLILADGGLSQLNIAGNSIFTYADKEDKTINELISHLKKTDPNVTYKKYDKSNYQIKSQKIRDILVNYKLAGKLSIHKEIPEDYLFTNIEDRKEFLRAYLLTDSYHQSKYSKVLYSSSRKLIEQLQHLTRSLGIYTNDIRIKPEPKYTYNDEIRIGQESYEFMININPKKNTKTIVNVEKLDYQENSRCITVDADDHLYLTRDFTVTHNSIVGIKTVELLDTKSLIIVPNDILEEQFVESIIEFTNLQKEDIGVIQGSDINELIKKGMYEKDIVVAKIQSLYAQLKVIDITVLEELYSVFGLVIYDEAHVGNASDGYSKTGSMFRTNNIISMTATPYRSGINEFIFKNNTGGILYQSDHQNLIPTINLHNGIIEFDDQELRRLQFARTDYVRFMATYNMILETKDAYFEWIANWVEYRASQGHNVAVLFATNKMVKKLSNILTRKGIDNGLLTGQTEKKPEVSKEYLTIGQVQIFYDNYFKVFPKRKKCPALKPFKNDATKYSLTKPILKDLSKIQATIPTLELETSWTKVNTMTEREIMKSKSVIVSNFKLLSAGFDKSELSCIIFGSLIVGKVPVIQSLGRICRTHPDKIQDVHAHFMFTQTFMNFFPDMMFTLTSNIKLQYPSKITYEGFDFEKKEKHAPEIKAAPVQH